MLQLSPTKQESRPEIVGRRRLKEGRILGTELIFTFPGGFINGMVQWSHHSVDEATWEREDELRAKYPTLFVSSSSS